MLLEADRIKGETTREEWIWAEQEAGARGPPGLPTAPTPPLGQEGPAELVTTLSTAPEQRDQPKALSPQQLLVGLYTASFSG